jgi:hypothetical protein
MRVIKHPGRSLGRLDALMDIYLFQTIHQNYHLTLI